MSLFQTIIMTQHQLSRICHAVKNGNFKAGEVPFHLLSMFLIDKIVWHR